MLNLESFEVSNLVIFNLKLKLIDFSEKNVFFEEFQYTNLKKLYILTIKKNLEKLQ